MNQKYYLSTTMELHTNSGPPVGAKAAVVDPDLIAPAQRKH